MDNHIDHIESLLEECKQKNDFRGDKFKSVLAKVNYVFDRRHDESCKRACDVILRRELLSPIAALWKESDSGTGDDDTITLIKTLIWNCSDRHAEFCKRCVLNTSLLSLLINGMKKYALDLHMLDDGDKRNAIRADFGILHNFLRHEPSTVDALKSLRAILTIACFRNSTFHMIQILSAVVLAFCGESITMDEIDCQYVINMIYDARGEADHIHKGQGLALEEILQFITQLVTENDKNKCAMVKANLLKSLDGIITESNHGEIMMCLELLWQLVTTESTKQSVIREQRIVKSIKDYYADASIPNEAKKKCASLLHTLKKSKNHVMLSYQWDSQKTILKLQKYLAAAGYTVWVDVNEMKGSLNNCMADAVENASIVLMGITQKYAESKNTKKEAEYAEHLGIPLLPLMLEKGYNPTGWLGILINGKIYVDLTDGSQNNFTEVTKQIQLITNS